MCFHSEVLISSSISWITRDSCSPSNLSDFRGLWAMSIILNKWLYWSIMYVCMWANISHFPDLGFACLPQRNQWCDEKCCKPTAEKNAAYRKTLQKDVSLEVKRRTTFTKRCFYGLNTLQRLAHY